MRRCPALLLACALAAGASLGPNATAQAPLRPIMHIEVDPDGTGHVRVMERVRTRVTPVERIANLRSSPRINLSGDAAAMVRDVTVRNAKYGLNVTGAGPVSIENFSFVDWDAGDGIHGAGIKIDRSAAAETYVLRVFADGMEAPDSSYARSNTDFIGIERHSGPVFVRYATGRRFGDAGVDAKSDAALMNVTIDGAHRGLRIWSGVTLTIANAIVNVPAGHEQVWMQRETSRLRYYNVLWCVGSSDPSPDDPACSTRPTAIGMGDISASEAREQMTALTSNPLAEQDFFATQIDRVVIEYSRDGGATWQVMATAGAAGRPPYGDMRYRIPFALSDGTYSFRAHFERNGARVGAPTTINEAGEPHSF